MNKLTSNQISSINEELFNILPNLLNHFNIDYVEYPNRFAFPCPVHSGDNPEGCCVFTDGTTKVGNWKCWTSHCEEDYTNNLFGFVRGILSQEKNKKLSLNEVANFCLKFLKKDMEDLIDGKTNNNHSVGIIEIFNKKIERTHLNLSRDDIRSRIKIPSEYYMKRGYTSEILNIFDVGECCSTNQPMAGRVVVPVYDEEYKYVGCVGRSVNNSMSPKWLHSKGFKKNVLYGLNVAHKYIEESGSVILVEGQGDVWRMHEAGLKNCVGIFGASINDDQLLLLEQSGALDVIILTDSDEAGNKAYEQIAKKCGRRFNLYRPQISTKDVGEMSVEQIQEEIFPQIKR